MFWIKPIDTTVTMQLTRAASSEDMFRLEIVDDKSRTHIVVIRMTPLAYADLVSGRNCVGTAEYYPHTQIGKTQETQEVHIPVRDSDFENRENVRKEAERKAHDQYKGWTIDGDGTYKHNSHNRDAGTYAVRLRRWV